MTALLEPEDVLVLILAPVRPEQIDCGVPGAVQTTADCGHRAWISPVSMAATLATATQTTCSTCHDAHSETTSAPVSAHEALYRLVSKELGDKLIAISRQHAQEGTFS